MRDEVRDEDVPHRSRGAADGQNDSPTGAVTSGGMLQCISCFPSGCRRLMFVQPDQRLGDSFVLFIFPVRTRW